MSWDIKALVILTLTWALLAAIDAAGWTGMVMMEAARAWGAGSLIFLVVLLGVWYAERRGAKAARRATRLEEEAERPAVGVGATRVVAGGSDGNS